MTVIEAILLLRYFESGGTLRVASSVVKKRSGVHERTKPLDLVRLKALLTAVWRTPAKAR